MSKKVKFGPGWKGCKDASKSWTLNVKLQRGMKSKKFDSITMSCA